jgi:hypothetical protein
MCRNSGHYLTSPCSDSVGYCTCNHPTKVDHDRTRVAMELHVGSLGWSLTWCPCTAQQKTNQIFAWITAQPRWQKEGANVRSSGQCKEALDTSPGQIKTADLLVPQPCEPVGGKLFRINIAAFGVLDALPSTCNVRANMTLEKTHHHLRRPFRFKSTTPRVEIIRAELQMPKWEWRLHYRSDGLACGIEVDSIPRRK